MWIITLIVFLVFLLYHQLQEKERKLEEMDREQIALIEMIAAERDRRDMEEEKLRNSIRVSKKFVL